MMFQVKQKNSGFILVSTLFILAFLVFTTQQLLDRMMVHDQFDHIVVAREKAKMIAMAGISLAQAQLSERDFKNYDKELTTLEDEKNKKPDERTKKMLLTILPHLNKWQTFALNKNNDGVDGELKICLMCENGKLNLNALFDFKKKQFAPEIQNLLKQLALQLPDSKTNLKAGELYALLNDYLKKRGKPLEDLSQLLEIPKLSAISFWYDPPTKSLKNVQPQQQRTIALNDLFTIWTPDAKIEPWLFSDATCAVLGLRRPLFDDAQKMGEIYKKVVSQFKPDLGAQWVQNWSILLPLYTKTPQAINEIAKILSQQFDPTVYTVISSGTVQEIEQKVLAVLMKQKKEQPQNSKDARPQQQDVNFKIMKLYWL